MERRRMMMGVEKLPYDAEIEYLQSTGTQWIDTGYYPNNATILYAKYYTLQGPHTPFAARWSGANTYDTFGLYVADTNRTVVYFGRYSNGKYIESSSSTSIITEVNIGLTEVIINGSIKSITRASFVSTYTMYVFAMNAMGTASFKNKIKLYKMTIKENNTTIFDFIPVRVGQVGYLYDKVSKQLFGNMGTGNFILGSDK